MGSAPAPPPTYQLQAQPQQDALAVSKIADVAAMPNYGQGIWDKMSPELLALAGPTGYDPAAPVNAGKSVIDNASGLPGYEKQVFADGFDPQNALRDRTAQQTQQSTRAAMEARGVDSTPYGAGVEADTMKNFNIDWQNNQLNREATAVQAGTTLGTAFDKANTTGIGLETIAPNLQGAAVSSLESAAGGAYAKPQMDAGNNLDYLKQGNANSQTAIQGYNAQVNASNNSLGGIGSAIGSIGGLFAGK